MIDNIYNTKQLNEKLNSLKSKYADAKWLDFSLSYNSENELLHIMASTDFSYYHLFEFVISEVDFVSPCEEWTVEPTKEFLSILNYNDKNQIKENLKIDFDRLCLKFITDENENLYFTGKEIKIDSDTVYYYKRKELLVGERLASWVS